MGLQNHKIVLFISYTFQIYNGFLLLIVIETIGSHQKTYINSIFYKDQLSQLARCAARPRLDCQACSRRLSVSDVTRYLSLDIFVLGYTPSFYIYSKTVTTKSTTWTLSATIACVLNTMKLSMIPCKLSHYAIQMSTVQQHSPF